MESKRPLTREILEERISKLQSKMDSLLERKAYAECDTLQLELDAFLAKRVELPTLDELKAVVMKAEQVIAEAAQKRDFKGAADGQKSLDEAERQLQQYLELHDNPNEKINVDQNEEESNDLKNDFIKSRAELDMKIETLSNQIQIALNQKNFDEASQIQPELIALEKLRISFPSRIEMQDSITKLKQAMDDALSSKDFTEAGNIDTKITALEKQLKEEIKQAEDLNITTEKEKENGTLTVQISNKMKTISSRVDLENEITKISSEVEKSVSEKLFDEASAKQKLLDKMIELRSKLPTLDELYEDLQFQKEKMNEAIARKDFSSAGQMNEKVEQLQRQYDKEHALQEKTLQEKRQNKGIGEKIKIQSNKTIPSIPTPFKSPTVTKTLRSSKEENASLHVYQTPFQSPMINNPINLSQSKLQDDDRPVKKLRPKKPMVSSVDDSVLSICQMLASKRGDASIITGKNGGLAGIITDTDITRRVVAKYLDPASTSVNDVMTANPTCVSMSDSAMDAMGTMVENHFRHLPVVDDAGSIVGVLGKHGLV